MVVTGTLPVFNLTMDGNSQVTKLVIIRKVECFYYVIMLQVMGTFSFSKADCSSVL